MAEGINKAILVGNLGADPELRYTSGGQAVCDMRMATSEKWTGKDGQPQERTEWHRIVVWGRSAESCNEYLRKGSQAYVEGRIQTRKWEDRDGNTRYTTEIVANRVLFLSGGKRSGGGGGFEEPPPPSDSDVPADTGNDDDIPF